MFILYIIDNKRYKIITSTFCKTLSFTKRSQFYIITLCSTHDILLLYETLKDESRRIKSDWGSRNDLM